MDKAHDEDNDEKTTVKARQTGHDGPLEVMLVTPEQPKAPRKKRKPKDKNPTHENRPEGGTGTPSMDPGIPADPKDPNMPAVDPNIGQKPVYPGKDAPNPYLDPEDDDEFYG